MPICYGKILFATKYLRFGQFSEYFSAPAAYAGFSRQHKHGQAQHKIQQDKSPTLTVPFEKNETILNLLNLLVLFPVNMLEFSEIDVTKLQKM